VVPWATSVAGAVTNYTSVDEARRRKTRDTLHTGKDNIKQVMQFVRTYNSTQVWSCVAPINTVQVPDFDPNTMFPACPQFQVRPV
jgi:hypothetical protein